MLNSKKEKWESLRDDLMEENRKLPKDLFP